jgi:hypothetical protein
MTEEKIKQATVQLLTALKNSAAEFNISPLEIRIKLQKPKGTDMQYVIMQNTTNVSEVTIAKIMKISPQVAYIANMQLSVAFTKIVEAHFNAAGMKAIIEASKKMQVKISYKTYKNEQGEKVADTNTPQLHLFALNETTNSFDYIRPIVIEDFA